MPVGYGEFGVAEDAHVARQIGRLAGLSSQKSSSLPPSHELTEKSMHITTEPTGRAKGELINGGHFQHVRTIIKVRTFLHDAAVGVVVAPALEASRRCSRPGNSGLSAIA